MQNLVTHSGRAPIAWMSLLALWAIAFAATPTYYDSLLKSHGVDTSIDGLAAFLENGWYGARPPQRLPQEPLRKSSLLIDAWRLLAHRYDDFLAAAPATRRAVGSTARAYAEGRIPPGAAEIVEEDLRSIDPSARVRQRELRLGLLRFNGVVAMGWFAEPDEANREALRRLLAREDRPLVRINYLKSLALLGDSEAIDGLIAEASKANRESSVVAAAFLSQLTGRTFDLTANRAVEPRAEAAQEIIRWRMRNPGAPDIDRTRVVARQLRAASAPTPAHDLHTLRGLLRASADKMDLANKRGSRTAWDQLERMGRSLVKHLEPILDNSREDLDVRTEAMRWYVRLEGKGARKRLKELRKDPNPEVARLAEEYLKEEPWEDSR